MDRLRTALQDAKSRYERNREYLQNGYAHEFRAQVLLINPILTALGWDVLDPGRVRIEEVADAGERKDLPRADSALADYALYAPGFVCAGVVEAKSPSVDLMAPKRQRQAHSYAAELGSAWVILTNGLLWRGWMNGDEKMGERCFLLASLTSDTIEECCEQLWAISYEKAVDLPKASA